MRHVLVLAACAALGACSTSDVASRGVSQPSALAYAPAYTLAGVEVDVPRSLSVSEANRIYPFADIVWRGEARGDRYEQVAAIFRDGAGIAAGKLTHRDLGGWVELERLVEPQTDLRPLYDRQFELFKKLYKGTKEVVHSLGAGE